jgi:hypothetical protein
LYKCELPEGGCLTHGHTGRRREEGWLVVGRFTTELKFKTVIKAKKPHRKPDSTLVLKILTKKSAK